MKHISIYINSKHLINKESTCVLNIFYTILVIINETQHLNSSYLFSKIFCIETVNLFDINLVSPFDMCALTFEPISNT